jgi:hypothetical protein
LIPEGEETMPEGEEPIFYKDSLGKNVSLDSSEVDLIDDLLNTLIASNTNLFDNRALSDYKRQLVPALNELGQENSLGKCIM